jgi:hypothetical protein
VFKQHQGIDSWERAGFSERSTGSSIDSPTTRHHAAGQVAQVESVSSDATNQLRQPAHIS